MKPELQQLCNLLSTGCHSSPFSAKELARWMHCSIPTVYNRLKALARVGAIIVEVREQHSSPGPTPTRYYLAKQQVQVPQPSTLDT